MAVCGLIEMEEDVPIIVNGYFQMKKGSVKTKYVQFKTKVLLSTTGKK